MAPSKESGKTILVNYKGANQESVSAGPADLVRLNPGINTVDADKWARIIAAAKKEKAKSKGGILYLLDNDLVAVVPAAGAGDGEGAGEGYVRVCVDGPVFDADEIAWDRIQS